MKNRLSYWHIFHIFSMFDAHIHDIELPAYNNFIRKPRAAECQIIDTKNIIAEILGGEKDAREEVQTSYLSDKNLLAGRYAVVLKYKREKDNRTYPVISMSYDRDETGDIIIRQIQRASTKNMSFRFQSSFDSVGYFIELIRTNFTNK